MPEPDTSLLTTPHGVELEYLISGAGQPVTVFAHGLGNGIAETRPLGSAVSGRRVFFQFRGHGRSSSPDGQWTYADLARDLRAVSDLTSATRALGVSLGAGALCRLLAESPARFDKVVLFLPAVLDQPRAAAARGRLAALLAALDSGEASEVADVLAEEVPPGLRSSPAAWSFLRQRMDHLMSHGLGRGLISLPDQVAVADRATLRAVQAPVLVIGCHGDVLHPMSIANELAETLPNATLHVYDKPGILWTQRTDLRKRIASFLNDVPV